MVVRWITSCTDFMHFPVVDGPCRGVVDHISCRLSLQKKEDRPTALARSILIKWHADDVVVTTSHATHSSISNS